MTLQLDRLTTVQFPPEQPQNLARAPSSTGVERMIIEASHHDDRGDAIAAEQAYVQADAMLGGECSPRRAEVLICLSLLQKRRGACSEAARHLDMALAIFPDHRAALTQRLALARELGDLATAAALRSRMLAFCESTEARIHVLTEVVADAIDAATAALRQAIALRPADDELLESLCSLLEATSDYDGAVNALVALAELQNEPGRRARGFARAARLCADRCANVDRSVALYEAAIADDPTVTSAFEAIEKVLMDAGDVEGTERAYIRQIERLRSGGHSTNETELLLKLARLRDEQLVDLNGAANALQRAITLCPNHVEAQLCLAHVLDRLGDSPGALGCLEIVTRHVPTNGAAYRQIQRVALNANDYARAFFAASALVHLGEADELEQAMYRRYATYGAPRVTRSLDDAGLALLRPAEHLTRQLLVTVHDAAISAKFALMHQGAAPPALHESERHDPDTSTVSAIRVIAWVVRLLGLPTFALYAHPQQSYALAHPMTAAPTLILGAGMLSGRSVPELLFRTAYELGAQRELGRLPVFYPTTAELQTLVAAVLGIYQPKHMPSSAVDLARAIDVALDERTRQQLRHLIDVAAQQRIVFDVNPLLHDVEIATGRLGLLACTDVTVAARQVAMESRPTLGLTAADRGRDLLAFSVSKAHQDVRDGLGMALGATSSHTAS